ncbi:MAG TPA: hypothetical protein VFH78_11980 [Candidatus Thermoplasmatota archaeon]|nr:hypothetical protein [Candidatus Thermoplasmatota archaeon]
MNRAILVCGLLAATFALSPVNADHNGEPGAHGDCSGEIITIGPVYYVITGDTPDHAWGYLETNGEDGLQRGGIMVHGNPDVCQESENPDFGWY